MNSTLIIEPYTDVVVGNCSVLFYNTFTGDSFISTDKIVFDLFSKENSNLFSFDIPADLKENSVFQDFYNVIIKKNMGKMLQKKGVAPVQLSEANNLEFVTVSRNNTKQQISHLNIVDLAIYLNGDTKKQSYTDAYKQFLCCKKSSVHIDLDNIVSFLEPLNSNNSIVRLHLLGGNVFQYSQFEALVQYFEHYFPKSALFIHCNFVDLTEDCAFTSDQNCKYIVTVYPDDDIERMSLLVGTECEIQFVVECENDLETVEQLVLNYNIDKYSIVPYFNGQNMRFFEDNVFTTADDILQHTVSMNEIQKNKVINTSIFGRIILDHDGNVYDNLNFHPIGHCCCDSVIQIVEKEINDKLCWFSIRNKVEPCKRCIYRNLCPPVGNMEYFMNRNNLCHAYQD